MEFPPRAEGVTAAPNRCRISARVESVGRSDVFADKWELQLEILESESISGPNFARVGEVARAFTVEDIQGVTEGGTIRAEAEFLGDERGGTFQLHEVEEGV